MLRENRLKNKIIDFEKDNLDSLIITIKRKYDKFIRVKLIKKGFIENFYEFRDFQVFHNDFQIEFRIVENGEFTFNFFTINQIKRSELSYTRHFYSLEEVFKELEQELLRNLYKNKKCLLTFI